VPDRYCALALPLAAVASAKERPLPAQSRRSISLGAAADRRRPESASQNAFSIPRSQKGSQTREFQVVQKSTLSGRSGAVDSAGLFRCTIQVQKGEREFSGAGQAGQNWRLRKVQCASLLAIEHE